MSAPNSNLNASDELEEGEIILENNIDLKNKPKQEKPITSDSTPKSSSPNSEGFFLKMNTSIKKEDNDEYNPIFNSNKQSSPNRPYNSHNSKPKNKQKRERDRSHEDNDTSNAIEKVITDPIDYSNKSSAHNSPSYPMRNANKNLCKYYLKGKCTRGDNCTFSHITKNVPCRFYIARGFCENMDSCKFAHRKIRKDEINKFIKDNLKYLNEAKAKYGKTLMDKYVDKYLANEQEASFFHQNLSNTPNNIFTYFIPNNISTNISNTSFTPPVPQNTNFMNIPFLSLNSGLDLNLINNNSNQINDINLIPSLSLLNPYSTSGLQANNIVDGMLLNNLTNLGSVGGLNELNNLNDIININSIDNNTGSTGNAGNNGNMEIDNNSNNANITNSPFTKGKPSRDPRLKNQ